MEIYFIGYMDPSRIDKVTRKDLDHLNSWSMKLSTDSCGNEQVWENVLQNMKHIYLNSQRNYPKNTGGKVVWKFMCESGSC